MTYRAEAVVPLEANFPTLRTISFTSDSNDELLGKNLDLIDEWREKAMIQLAYYHQKLKQGYDANVRLWPLAPGDLVLKKVLGNAKKLKVFHGSSDHKSWETNNLWQLSKY